MLKHILLMIGVSQMIFLSCGTLIAQTNVSGDVTGVWMKASSPYIVTSNIRVPAVQTLTIEPGVVVKFNGNYRFDVLGRLNASGTKEDSIIFTSNLQNPSPGSWGSISFDAGSHQGSALQYCRIEYASTAIATSKAVILSNNKIRFNRTGISIPTSVFIGPVIRDNEIFSNAVSGIFVDYRSTVTIVNNIIRDNFANGIYLYNHESKSTVKYNVIFENSSAGILCENSSPEIINNTVISNFGGGIVCRTIGILASPPSKPIIKNCIVFNNSGQIKKEGTGTDPTVSYSDIMDSHDGVGNINANPLFVDESKFDFHLKVGSPCINVGDPSSPKDPDSTRADMGALYYDLSTDVHDQKVINLPDRFVLEQNYPNPFNPSTTIRYVIPKDSYVMLKVYNLLGKEIETLVNKKHTAGEYKIQWNPVGLPSGVYVYQLQVEKLMTTKKLILLQ